MTEIRLRGIAPSSAFVTGVHIAAAIGAVGSIVLAAFVLTVGLTHTPAIRGQMTSVIISAETSIHRTFRKTTMK